MQAALAAHLGITPSAICRWDIVPAERVGPVSDYTGWPKHRLRPDLWPRPRKPKAKAKAKAKRKAANGATK